MADLIERSAVLSDLESLWDYSTVDGITASTVLKQVKTDVKNIPTVDAVPVVRCGECWKHSFCINPVCRTRYDYCSAGERREGETDGRKTD